MNYYNDNDPKSCAWLRELIAAGEIPDGVVDERSILDVQPADLAGFVQCHFFAGIGGWSLALKLAGWPEGRSIWTGSAPCQPYSAAGKGKGDADARNLWPAFFRLIKARKPECVIGEQVAAAIGHGWLDGICDDLEGQGYTTGAAVLGAYSVGAPHIRQRLYWVGYAQGIGRLGRQNDEDSRRRELTSGHSDAGDGGVAHAQRDAGEPGRVTDQSTEGFGEGTTGPSGESGRSGVHGWVDDANAGRRRESDDAIPARRNEPVGPGSGVDNATGNGAEHGQLSAKPGSDGAHHGLSRPSGHWDDYQLIPCADGKARRIKSGLQPLAHGVSGRVGLLRGAGNAIVPQTAAAFIKAVMG